MQTNTYNETQRKFGTTVATPTGGLQAAKEQITAMMRREFRTQNSQLVCF